MKIRNYLAVMIALLASLYTAKADGIFKGTRGPTNWQIDTRIRKGEDQLILKYWDGKEKGKFGFVSYKLDNITVGIGPRGKKGNLNWTLYVGTNGESEQAGLLMAYLLQNGKIDIDGAFVQNLDTGETYSGMVIGKELSDKVRIAAGATNLNNDPAYRIIFRYTPSKTWHLEMIKDEDKTTLVGSVNF